jgi:hypothetical protein
MDGRMPTHNPYTARTLRILDEQRDDPYAPVEPRNL